MHRENDPITLTQNVIRTRMHSHKPYEYIVQVSTVHSAQCTNGLHTLHIAQWYLFLIENWQAQKEVEMMVHWRGPGAVFAHF